jgi:3-hydroxyacyl-[acyl-carrier-protein] dehydratase
MPPPLLFDLAGVDLNRTILSREQIYELLPHRFEFMLLSGVCYLDRQNLRAVAFADIRADAWWVRGHVPGRPLLPGVVMLEMAAQTAAVTAKSLAEHQGFLGYGGVEDCKFREVVTPPARLYILCTGKDYRPRRIISQTQGVCDGKMVFEAQITGVTIR